MAYRPSRPWAATRRRTTAAGAAALASALLLAACGSSDGGGGASGPEGVRLVSQGKLTTCTNVPYEPFQFKQGQKVVGFDVDIVDLAAKRLGVTQEIIDIDFAAIKSGSALNSNRCDLAAAGMTITPDREKNLTFSAPYFDATQALMAKKGSGVTSLADVKTKGLTLGAQASTTGLEYARQQEFDPIEFADSPKELLGLQTGQADVIIQDHAVVATWLKKPEVAAKFELVANLNTGEQYGIGMKKGNTALKKVVDEVIQQARTDGTYDKIYQKWIGTAVPTPSPAGT
ncbi:ABC transporter substrate-binding protein [Spongiactinospora rosea]|uniref:ABC transporter substrate-binding protein n=1 Tax=Spongiactinospora rosea TaxID=2248750 RepID=A0A366LQ05_9ACTN|nr:ABC transporter substrate-binding protein [Spongiactinospora rosea]RBQ15404.1 ABC transporter substrate-binding protein [Spongiactinospora rosea]